MRTMSRNRQTFYEAELLEAVMGQDTDGNYTEVQNEYSIPRERVAVITPASGMSDLQLFGANENYDKVITLNKGETYLKVGSVLWIDTPIELAVGGTLAKNEDGTLKTPYNYVVVRVSESLNFVTVAIRKVDVT